MSYGARARRVPALGGSQLTDVDIYKVALLGKTERGIVDSNGFPVAQKEIFSMNDFYVKCGGFNQSYYAAYVAQSFFDELERSTNCEMKVVSPVDVAAIQAGYIILDEASSPVKIFDVKAGRLGQIDKSAFGNKIAVKITHVSEISMKLTASVDDAATTAILDSVDNLEVGNYIKFVEGSDEEVRAITAINQTTKQITFAAISESSGFSASGATVYRLDWKLEVAVKDSLNNYQKKEEWSAPFAKSNIIGLVEEVNNTESGSDFVILTVNAANASAPEDQLPAELTVWTALTGGADGSAASDSTWDTMAEDYLTSEEFTFLLAPESSSIDHNGNMLDFCTDGYKGIYYAQSSDGATEGTLKNFGASLRGSIKFGMIPSDKWIGVDDPVSPGSLKNIPKVGIDAGFWFNTYTKYGESKVAAGNKSEMVLKTSGTLRDSNGLVHDDREGKGGRMIRSYSVNICRYRKGKGITNNSARTLSTDDGYKYQNQIMQWLLYSRSIVAFLKEIEQDKAGVNAMQSHYNAVWAYMTGKYKLGHLFQGQKEDGTITKFEDVCIIVNDFTINTLANINNGIEEIFLQFVGVPPIEEPILSLASAAVTTVKA